MNRFELESMIKRNGYTMEQFATEMGISRSAFYRKMRGNTEFTQSEIQKVMDLLRLPSPVGIFFAEKVS